MSMRTTHSGWNIEKILRFWGNGTIQIPDEQREQAWKKGKKGDKKRSDFIDSVFNNFPIPSCILFLKVDEEQDKYDIFDGQNRFRTLFAFSKNEFTYKGKRFKDLDETDKDVFHGREIQVTEITNGDTVMHLMPTVFTRLNAGVPLSDSDFCHANQSKPLIASAIRLVVGNPELAAALGGFNIQRRTMLAHCVGITLALSRADAGVYTTSYDHFAPYIEKDVKVQSVVDGIAAYTNLVKQANLSPPPGYKKKDLIPELKCIIHCWLADWIGKGSEPYPNQMMQDKWRSIIYNLRSNSEAMKKAFKQVVGGANNANAAKLNVIRKQLREHVRSADFILPRDDTLLAFSQRRTHTQEYRVILNELSESLHPFNNADKLEDVSELLKGHVLKDHLKSRYLSVTGSKPVLVERLKEVVNSQQSTYNRWFHDKSMILTNHIGSESTLNVWLERSAPNTTPLTLSMALAQAQAH